MFGLQDIGARAWTTLLLSISCLALFAHGQKADMKGPPAADRKAVVDGDNAFAVALYGQLQKQNGNLVFSPYSISTALAMTYAGARGETAAQMAKTIHFTLGPERLHPAFANLNWQLHGEGKALPFRLNVANALWIQSGYPTHAAFRQIAQDHYASDV